jgi:hypothetical protein
MEAVIHYYESKLKFNYVNDMDIFSFLDILNDLIQCNLYIFVLYFKTFSDYYNEYNFFFKYDYSFNFRCES